MRSLCAAVSTAAFLCLLPACGPTTPPVSPYTTMAMETVKLVKVLKLEKMEVESGHGSGVIVSPNFILTAAHVPNDDGARQMTVKFSDGTTGTATLAWEDKVRDVALMKLAKPTKLKPAILSQGLPHIGDTIYAAGYPLMLPLAIQQGQIASEAAAIDGVPAQYKKLQAVKRFASVIVINCIIAPGDSGGPVFNAQGEVIGINDLQFLEGGDENNPAISGLNGMIGIQFIIGDVFAQIASA